MGRHAKSRPTVGCTVHCWVNSVDILLLCCPRHNNNNDSMKTQWYHTAQYAVDILLSKTQWKQERRNIILSMWHRRGLNKDVKCISNGILLKQSGRLHSEDCSTPREEKEKAPVQESALLQDRLRVAAHCRRNERKPHAMFDLDCTNLLSPFLALQDTGYLGDFWSEWWGDITDKKRKQIQIQRQ